MSLELLTEFKPFGVYIVSLTFRNTLRLYRILPINIKIIKADTIYKLHEILDLFYKYDLLKFI